MRRPVEQLRSIYTEKLHSEIPKNPFFEYQGHEFFSIEKNSAENCHCFVNFEGNEYQKRGFLSIDTLR